ncbi:MAG: hypothetical protein JWR16_624 [Nevskia sp.]|nr:hypothetical protein [Nevskia sp.]
MKRFFGLLLCCAPLLASAQIYRWVDSSGQVHFSQNPPASGAYKNVTPAASSVAPSPGRAKTALGDSVDQQTLKLKADNAERCAKVRERISFLEQKTASRLFKTGDDGQPTPLTQAEFDQQLNDAKTAGSKYCS